MKGLLLAATLTLQPSTTPPPRDVVRGAPALPATSEERVLRLAAYALSENGVPTFPGVLPQEVERVFSKAFLPSGAIDPAWWERFNDLVDEESRGTRSVAVVGADDENAADGAFVFYILINTHKVRKIELPPCTTAGYSREMRSFYLRMLFRPGPRPFFASCGG